MSINIDGICEEGFEDVRESFRKNFSEGWEKGGAAFCAFVGGQKVVDLWGGYADRKCKRLWREDTLTTIFSCTKSVASICMAILVDRGLCSYEDKVTEYWPEFGANGKENITIEMVLNHKAGLSYLDGTFTMEEMSNLGKMSEIIEKQKPNFLPGSKTAYECFAFGWILDQIFRRIDQSGRTIGQFFREEIAEKHHVDVHIGETAAEEARVARISGLNPILNIREFAYDRKIGKMGVYFYNPKGYFHKAMKNMANFGDTFCMYNNNELRSTGQPAVNGIATARGLAHSHQILLDGAILSSKLLQDISTPPNQAEFDHTIGEEQRKAHGFMYTTSPMNSWQFGHSGVGGQIVKVDVREQIVIAYLTNAMKAGTGEHIFTCNRLTRKLYDCVKKLKEKKVAKQKSTSK